jgi:cell wall-associated NlpC family hydrolase
MPSLRRPISPIVSLLAVTGLWLALAGPVSASWFWPSKKSRPPQAVAVAITPPPTYYAAAAAYESFPTAAAPVPRARAVTVVRRAVAIPELDPRPVPVIYAPPTPSRSPRVTPPTPSATALARECESLARRGLSYRFGSMDPATGGLDCSGTVKCVLERSGVRGVPRTASDQYLWLQNAGTLTPLRRGANPDWILSRLRPGDLLFWRGTYVTNRWPDVSHVMIYLGRDRRTGRPMMFGARSSDSSGGIHGHAVDIYEFNPIPRGKSEFIGFGRVPR